MISRACAVADTPIATFLTASAVRQAHAMGLSAPYIFEGRAFATEGLTDAWYDATSEAELVAHLKDALLQGRIQLAQAMAIELLDFPADRSAIDLHERTLTSEQQGVSLVDGELVALVVSVLGIPLENSARTWDCYKAIVGSASAECRSADTGSQAKR